MIPIRSILAATDLGPAGDPVLQSAAALAQAVQADLHIVHVAPPWNEEDREHHASALTEQVDRCLTSLREEAEGEAPIGLKVEQEVIYDRPHHGILVHAATVDADLIVVGPHRGHAVGARWSGTTAERIVRSADVPCLVVNRTLSLPIRHAGVAVDFEMASRGAAVLAGNWLPPWGSDPETPTLSLIHVADPGDDESETRLDTEVERIRGGALGEAPLTDVRVEGVLRRGSTVAPQITEWAETAGIDLLVTSTSASRGWQRLWRGSRATALTTQVPCPVLLVPPSFWRRSPIPLSTVAVAIERDEAGEEAWAWIERMQDGAPRPLQVTALDPNAPLLPSAREANADLLVVHEPHMEAYERTPEDLRALLEHTPIPVLVLRDLPREPIRHILVAVDTGDIWYEKLGWAKRLVDRFDARVTIYHAIDLSLSGRVRREPGGEFVSGSSAWLHAGVEDKIIPAMELWLWERVRLAGLDPAHVDVRVGVHPSWFAIPAVAENIDADLVIVAAHGERRTGRARLSRLARAALERGTYSTLVVVDRARRVAEWGEPDWSAVPRPSPPEPS